MNHQVVYSTDSDFFEVSQTGEILSLIELDREMNSSIIFSVLATDRGVLSLNGTGTVTVTIVDENDNSPMFIDSLPRQLNIRENTTIGTVLGTILATDSDDPTSQNSVVSYFIVGGSGQDTFEVDQTSGDLRVSGALDAENISFYQIEVLAADNGDPVLNTSTIYNISIIDTDDNVPLFTRETYEFSIRENNNPTVLVGQVVSEDLDPLGRPIGYRINSRNSSLAFEIRRTTGEIFATQIFNLEDFASPEPPQFTFIVETFYQDDQNTVTDTATVLLSILDIHEFGVIIRDITLNAVDENIPVNMSVGRIDAIDRDPTSRLAYFLSVSQDVLRVDSNTGEIFVNGPIDHESPALFPAGFDFCPVGTSPSINCLLVVVRVQDLTSNATAANTTFLLVQDVDDEPPVFSRSIYSLNVSESVPLSYALTDLNIRASDPDYNILLEYTIPASEGVTDFTIQSFSGLIQVSDILDFEDIQRYRFTIYVNDTTDNFDSAVVEINILDDNDNIPMFDQEFYSVTIPENYPVNSVVTILNATDRDSTTNGAITYVITAGDDNDEFVIDPILGDIQLVRSLDRENTPFYSLTIEAVDAGTPASTGTATLNITLGDVNDHPPRFLQTIYRGFVNETAQPGNPVLDSNGDPLVTSFNDPDEGAVVTIIAFSFGLPFFVNPQTGEITFTQSLDFEMQNSYEFVVLIRDDLMMFGAPATVVISVLPINDHQPLFERDLYSVSIEENDREGDVVLTVVAADPDVGDAVFYSIITNFNLSEYTQPEPTSGMLLDSYSGSASGIPEFEPEEVTFPFEINSTTGEIKLLRNLDYEVAQEWRFNVSGVDNGDSVDVAEVIVTVEDLNDNAPRFTEHVFEIALSENTTLSRTEPASVAITATDADVVSRNNLRYFVLSGAEGIFEINRENGYLYVVAPLSSNRMYTVQLLVTDGELEDTARARIRVIDINNNGPVFTQQTYFGNLVEGVPAGTMILRVEAVDRDLGIFAQVFYEFVPTKYSDLFRLDMITGEIFTNNVDRTVFDFETPPREYNILVRAFDGAAQPQSSLATVTIFLQDANDNAPVFTNLDSEMDIEEASEIGTSVFQVMAVDADDGSNAQIEFLILNENASFAIDSETGIVTVVSSLDFDDENATTRYVLDIVAVDGGIPPQETTSSLTVNILDSNDNAPQFEANLIREVVPENTLLSAVAFNISAFDIDSGTNSELTYAILSVYPDDCASRFRIDNSTRYVLLNELVDAEARGEPCTLIVQATDGGSPPRSTLATYVVIVTNINEHPPTFVAQSLIGSVRENSPNGTFVLQVMTTDLDGNNVAYRAAGGAVDVFDVSLEGAITVADDAELDREETGFYTILVEAQDDGLPEMTVTGTATITIVDENDNAPVFTELVYLESVREDHPLLEPPILFVQAIDNDTLPNNIVEYSFILNHENETDYGIFDINSETGAIFLVNSLDYEQEPRFYYLRVQATDGLFIERASVNIRVLEANDIVPMFTNLPNSVRLSENATNGSVVYQVTAVDFDQSVNGRITYSLVNSSELFEIDSDTGVIYVRGIDQFDFEVGPREYRLLINATDNAGMDTSGDYDALQSSGFGNAPLIHPDDLPNSAVQYLDVVITDINDNAPEFLMESYLALIIEHNQLPLLVVTVQATDEDEVNTPNSVVRYRIADGSFGKFNIDPVTGVISTIPPLDREVIPIYTLRVEAYDLGDPELSSSVIVTITVIDTNDERPVFRQGLYTGSIAENSPPGTPVLTVSAIDPDDFTAPLNYTLFDTSGYFEVDQFSGVIVVSSRNINREEVQNITFTAQAVDQDGFVATTVVSVTIEDVNDNAPLFGQRSYTYTITENTPVGSIVDTIATFDADTGMNAITEYLVMGGNGTFDVNRQLGDLLVTNSLCFSDSDNRVYTFMLVARNMMNTSLSDSVEVKITVFKENSFPPEFVQPSYVSRLDELARENTIVIPDLRTIDQDICSGRPIFELFGGNGTNTFAIDSMSGRITLARNLTTEDLSFTLRIRATDTANFILPSLSSDVGLIVLVGQLLPVSIDVIGGLTVPTISRLTTEEYQQDLWLYDGGSLVNGEPVVRYSLGNIVTEARIPILRTRAVSVGGAISQSIVYPDDPYVRVGLQVQGERYENPSVEPTTVFAMIRSSAFPGVTLSATCVTESPTASCVAEVMIQQSWFSNVTTATVYYGISSQNMETMLGEVETVPDPVCSPPSSPNVVVSLPYAVVYPGQYIDISIVTNTNYETDSFLLSFSMTEGLEFEELMLSPSSYFISSASNENTFTISGLNSAQTSASSGVYQLEFEVRLHLDSDAEVSADDPLNINCTVDYIVNGLGEADISYSPALHSGYNSNGDCYSSFGQILTGENIVAGLFPFARSPALLNTAVLNNQTVNGMLNVLGLLNSGEFTREVPDATCESTDEEIIKVESDCSQLFLSGGETSGSDLVFVNVSTSFLSASTAFRVWYPTEVALTLSSLELSSIGDLYDNSDGSCSQVYENANIEVDVVFMSGEDTQLASITPYVSDLTSSNESVLVVRRAEYGSARAVGVAPGVARVQFEDYFGRIHQSQEIVVTETTATVEDISFSLHSDLFPLPLAATSPGIEYLKTTVIELVSEFDVIGANVEVLAETVLSNGRNFELSPSNGLVLRSADTEIIEVSGSEITVRGIGMGRILEGEVSLNECPGSITIRTSEFIDIQLNPIDRLEVVLETNTLALQQDSETINVPYQTSYTAELVHENGVRVPVTFDQRLSFTSDIPISFGNGTLDISNVIDADTLNFNVSYEFTGIAVPPISVYITVLGIQDIELFVTPYPLYSQWPNSGDVLLERYANTDRYQQAEIRAYATLSNGFILDVTDNNSTMFRVTEGVAYAQVDGNIVVPQGPGNVTVSAYVGSRISSPLFIEVGDDEVYAEDIVDFSLPLVSSTLSAEYGEVITPALTLLFNDGTYYPNFITPDGAAVPGIVQFTNTHPATLEFDAENGDIVVLQNSFGMITLEASLVNDTISSNISFLVDLLPRLGELDVEGLLYQTFTDQQNISADIYLNAEGYLVGALEFAVYFNPGELYLMRVTPGRDLQSFVAAGEYEDAQNSGAYRWGVIFLNSTISTNRMHVARVEFTAQGVVSNANFSVLVTNLNDASESFSTIGEPTPRYSPAANIVQQLEAPPPLVVCTSPPCSRAECSSLNITAVAGDTNGDCVFDLVDAVYAHRVIPQLTVQSPSLNLLPDQLEALDANRNGVLEPTDVRFLVRNRMGQFPLISELNLIPIGAEFSDCRITINTTLQSWDGRLLNEDEVFVYFGLFHPSSSFETQYDGAVLTNGTKLFVQRPSGTFGGWIEPLYLGDGVFHVQTEPGTIAQSDIGFLMVYGTYNRQGVPVIERTRLVTGQPSQPPAYSTISASFSPMVGQSPLNVVEQNFNPQQFFDNSFPAALCYNNFAPVIDPDLGVVLITSQPENLNISAPLRIVSATDADSPLPAGNILFSLENVLPSGTIDIDPITGLIFVANPLDREEIPQITGLVVATDQGAHVFTRMTDTIEVVVNLLDVNDNAPLADEPMYAASIIESAPTFATVFSFTGGDLDVTAENRGFSSIVVTEGNGSVSDIFAANSTETESSASGSRFTISLYLMTPLDRETQDRYNLTVTMTDRGNPAESSSVDISVRVIDANDLRPQFISPDRVEIIENNEVGTALIRVRAVDEDIGSNAVFTFIINSVFLADRFGVEGPNPQAIIGYFAIDPNSGLITVNRSLDRDEEFSFRVNIVAIEEGIPFFESAAEASQSLWVMVCEQNDNTPLFDEEAYNVTVPENSDFTTVVTQLIAKDADLGSFCSGDSANAFDNALRYTLLTNDVPFIIDPTTGDIIVDGSLDFENTVEYSMVIRVNDLGVGMLNSTTNLTIFVTDVNDNPPVLSNDTYFNFAVEDSEIGTSVIEFISATDEDSGIHAEIRFTLSGIGNEDFDIDNNTGEITVAQSLDRERIAQYNLTVIAFNPEAPQFMDTAQVTIGVIDINDSPPVFGAPSYSVQTSENVPVGHVALSVFATDADTQENRVITYAFAEDYPNFEMDPTTGEIRTRATLCTNDDVTYTLVALAMDNPVAQLIFTTSINVTIVVFDDNSADPVFTRPEYAAIVEDGVSSGIDILTVGATDRDSCSPPFSYSFKPSSVSNLFAIDNQTGVLSTAATLRQVDASVYYITVLATDSGTRFPRTGNATVIVLVGESVPVEFSTTVGYPVSNARIESSSEGINEYEQTFNFFYGINSFSPPVTLEARFGENIVRQMIEVDRLPASSANAILLTPIVQYDSRVIQVALAVVDEFGSSRVEDTNVYVNATTVTNGVVESVGMVQETSGSTAILRLELPQNWFREDRNATISYGVVGYTPATLASNIVLVPTPKFEEICTGVSGAFFIVEAPSYLVYRNQVVALPILAQQSGNSFISAYALQCTVGSGMEFTSDPVESLPGWVSRFERSSNRRQLTFTTSRTANTSRSTVEYEFVGKLTVSVSASTAQIITISCSLLEAVDNNGGYDSFTDVLVVDREGCSPRIGSVSVSRDTLVGALPLLTQTVLVNDVVLSGVRYQVYPNVMGIILGAQPNFIGIITRGLTTNSVTCTSEVPNVLGVTPSCTEIYLNGSELRGAENIRITLDATTIDGDFIVSSNAFPVELVYHVWFPDLPVSLSVMDANLSPVEGWMVDNADNTMCVQAYQRASIEATAIFRLGSDSVSLRVENLLNLISNDSTVVSTSGSEISGVSPGAATIQAENNGRSERVLGSIDVTVDSSPVGAIEFDTIYASTFSAVSPDSVPYSGSEPFEAVVDLNLLYETQSAHLVSTVVFSDATRYRVSRSQGLSYSTLNSSIFEITDANLRAQASGSGDLLQATWSSCGGSIVLSRDLPIDISLLVPEISVTISDTFLIHSSDPAATLGSIATSASISVELLYRVDDEIIRRVGVTNDAETVYSFSQPGLLSLSRDGSTMSLGVNSTDVNATVILTVAYQDSESVEVSVEIGYSSSLSAFVSPYPQYNSSDERIVTVLAQIGNTGVYQQATISTVLNLYVPSGSSNPTDFDITSHSALTYSTTNTVLSTNDQGVVTPAREGSSAITVSLSRLSVTTPTIIVLPTPIQVVRINNIRLTSGDTIVGAPGEGVERRLSVSVELSDGTFIDEVYSKSGQIVSSLLNVVSNNPSVFTVNSNTGRFTILSSVPGPVSVNVSVNQVLQISETFQFYTNLEPGAGQLDLGSVSDRPIAPVNRGETFDVPLRMDINLGGNTISALDIEVAYSDSLIELVSVSAGSDWPSTELFESSDREFRGFVYFGGILDDLSVNSGVVELAVLTFRAVDNVDGVAAISGQFRTLLDRSSPTQEITPQLSPAANVGVFVGDVQGSTALPDVTAQVNMAKLALSPTVTQCSNGVEIDGVEMGDLNGDCLFNLNDVLHLRQRGCAPTPSLDYNFDGVCNAEELYFLLRANYRVVQFVEVISITIVNETDCFLTIDAVLTGRGRPVSNGARTSLLFGLFNRNPDFQQQVDDTTIFINIGRPVGLSGDLPASTNGGFFEASEVSPIGTYRTILNTPISNTDVGFVLVQARVDAFGTLTSTSRVEMMQGSSSIPVFFPESISAVINHPTGLDIPFQYDLGFNPIMRFDQLFSSPDCINFDRPTFFPNVTVVEHYENLEIGSVVAVVFANDSDAGPNAVVEYSFFSPTDVIANTFKINATTGAVTLLSSLDRETRDSFFIALRANDTGILGSLDGIGELVVRVLDVNDEPPVFDEEVYMPTGIPEDTQVPFSVTTVNADDADLGENASVSYELLEPRYHFDINATTGEILLVSSLDYENQTQFELTVVASDGGTPSLSSNATVIIDVEPVNDNIPECYPTQRLALVPEDEFNGTMFFFANVTDADMGADHNVLNYTLADVSSEFSVFKIDDNTAALYTITDSFDRFITPSYELTIVVSDVGGQSCSINVTVVVAEPSRFVGFSIDRNGAGFFVGPVTPRNERNGYNQQVGFFRKSLANGTVSGGFGGETSFALYEREAQRPARMDAVLHNDEVWFDYPVITAVAQIRDISHQVLVDSSAYLEIRPSDDSSVEPLMGEACEPDFGDDSGLCFAEITVPGAWFDYNSVNVTVQGNGLSVDLGSVNLISPRPAVFTQDNLIIELPSFTIYPDTDFTIYVGAPLSLDVTAFEFTFQLPAGIQISSIVENTKWDCYGVLSAQVICLRLISGVSNLSPIGTDRFFGIQASASSLINPIDDQVSVNVTSLVTPYGSVISASQPALLYNRYGLGVSPMSISLEGLELLGIFANSLRTEFVNTAPLDGRQDLIDITVYAVYNRPSSQFGVQTSGILCNTSDTNLEKNGTCSFALSTTYQQCSSESAVNIEHTISGSSFSLPLKVWCYNSSRIDMSDKVLNLYAGLDTLGCTNASIYQRSVVRIIAQFVSGDELSPEVDISEYTVGDLYSNNTTVAMVFRNGIVGASPGEAVVSFRNIPGLQEAVSVTVSDEPVEVYSIYPTIFSSFDIQTNPMTYDSDSSLTMSAVFAQNFNNVGISGFATGYAYFTDGARIGTATNDLSFTSLSPAVSVQNISTGVLVTQEAGIANVEVSLTPSFCNPGTVIDSVLVSFAVTTPQPVRLELQASENMITGDTRGVTLNQYVSSSAVTATLVYDDGSSENIFTSDLTYSVSESLFVMEEATQLNVTSNTSVTATSGDVTVQYLTPIGQTLFSTLTLTIVNVESLTAGLQAYPNSVSAPSQSISLEQFPGTVIQQQAQIYAEVSLSDGTTYPIPASEKMATVTGIEAIMIENGIVSTRFAGSTTLSVSVGELTVTGLSVQVQSVPLIVQGIELIFEDITQVTKQVIANVNFSDGTVINDIFAYHNDLSSSLLTFMIDPANVASIDPSTWVLSITNNYFELVSLIATSGRTSTTISFAANLEPETRGIDLGRATGIPQPPVTVGDEFTIDVRLNVGNEDIGVLDLLITYNSSILELGSFDMLLSGFFALRTNAPPGEIQLAVSSSLQTTEQLLTIAQMSFTAIDSETPTLISSNVRTLRNTSLQVDTLSSTDMEVLVAASSTSRRRRDTHTPSHLSNSRSARATSLALGDVNVDGEFNVVDAAFLYQNIVGFGQELSSDLNFAADANKDGEVNIADVTYLTRASAGLVPLLDTTEVSAVSDDSNCLLEIESTFAFGRDGPDTSRTFVYFIISYPGSSDIINQSIPDWGGAGRILDNTSVIFEATPLNETSNVYRSALITPIDIQLSDLGLSMVIFTVDYLDATSSERLATFFSTRSSYFVSTDQLIPQLTLSSLRSNLSPFVSSISNFTFGDQNGFSPLLSFTNLVRSDYCEFDGSRRSIGVLENQPVGETFITVSAVGDNLPSFNEVYTIVSTTVDGVFNITLEGELQLMTTLDFETTSFYIITVNAFSLDGNYDIGNLTLEITVVDVNDFAPEFVQPNYLLSLVEDRIPDAVSSILQVNANDRDIGLNGIFNYSLDPLSDLQNRFNLDPISGELFLMAPLDRETSSSYSLTIYAVDMGVPEVLTGTTIVTVTVEDVNDNPPQFDQDIYNVEIPEDFYNASGDNIILGFQIIVTDPDLEENSTFTLNLLPIDLGGPFSLDNNGFLELTSTLDRETRDSYSYTIQAVDQGPVPMSSTATLIISVADVNDNPPICSPANDMMLLLEEDTIVDTLITTIGATDNDAVNNSIITYSIDDASVPFAVDPVSGELTTSRALDINLQQEYSLSITALDSGDIPQSAECSLTVTVTEGQVVSFDVGERGFLFGERVRSGERRYVQSVGALFGENIGTSVPVHGGINTATSSEIDRAVIPNPGDVPTRIEGSLLQSDVKHSVRTITAFLQAYDSRDTIPRPTTVRARLVPSDQISSSAFVEGTCTTSQDLGYCIVQVRLPDDWFARGSTNPATDRVRVWANFANENNLGISLGELVVEHSPAYEIDFGFNSIALVAPSHTIYPGQNFSMEVYVISPLEVVYSSVSMDLSFSDQSSFAGLTF